MTATRKEHSIKQTPVVDQSKTPGVLYLIETKGVRTLLRSATYLAAKSYGIRRDRGDRRSGLIAVS